MDVVVARFQSPGLGPACSDKIHEVLMHQETMRLCTLMTHCNPVPMVRNFCSYAM